MALQPAQRASLARRYAEGLFRAMPDEERERAWRVLQQLKELWMKERALRVYLRHPEVPVEKKVAALEKLLGLEERPRLRGFLELLIKRDRVFLAEEIAARYRELLDAWQGRMRGQVETAFPLSEEQLRALEEVFSRKLGKQVILEARVQPELLGGVAVFLGGKVYDGTLRNWLRSLRARLLEEGLWREVKWNAGETGGNHAGH